MFETLKMMMTARKLSKHGLDNVAQASQRYKDLLEVIKEIDSLEKNVKDIDANLFKKLMIASVELTSKDLEIIYKINDTTDNKKVGTVILGFVAATHIMFKEIQDGE